jgi:superfamily II DNA helicase RecQ
MPYRIFQVPSYGDTETEQALNDFLGTHRVLCVTHEFVNAGSNSFWTFCVDYMEQGSGGKVNASGGRRSRIDYQEVLEPDEFVLFARLRDLRKDLSGSEGVPVYAIFTNEQLAQVVQKRVTSKASMHAISGLGAARIEKYGDRTVAVTSEYWSQHHEEGGTPV